MYILATGLQLLHNDTLNNELSFSGFRTIHDFSCVTWMFSCYQNHLSYNNFQQSIKCSHFLNTFWNKRLEKLDTTAVHMKNLSGYGSTLVITYQVSSESKPILKFNFVGAGTESVPLTFPGFSQNMTTFSCITFLLC